MIKVHEPVLLSESINMLKVKKGGQYIDGTLGAGGHSAEISKMGGNVLGIDQDLNMLDIAKENLGGVAGVDFVHGNFRDIDKIAKDNDLSEVDGILIDLGVSSVHFDDMSRGFSFRDETAGLDMRLNRDAGGATAADLLNALRKDQLIELFRSVVGGGAKRLSDKIIAARGEKRYELVGDLLRIFPKKTGRVHPATKAFMALRMAVNSELESLEEVLPKAFDLLKPGGRLVVISFHSLEDALVKKYMFQTEKEGTGVMVLKSPVVPGWDEMKRNPRSRSAKMRAITKI